MQSYQIKFAVVGREQREHQHLHVYVISPITVGLGLPSLLKVTTSY